MFHYVSEVVSEVVLGIVFWSIVGIAICFGIWGFRDGILIGFIIGSVMSVAYFIHLSLTAETAVDMMDDKGARNKTVVGYILRLVVGAAVIFLAWKSGKVNMLAVLGGLFTLKFGVYSRLPIHKIFQHFGKHMDTVSEEALEGARKWAEEEEAEKAAKRAAAEAAAGEEYKEK